MSPNEVLEEAERRFSLDPSYTMDEHINEVAFEEGHRIEKSGGGPAEFTAELLILETIELYEERLS